MSFNELNSVEHFIIHKLTGVNLNNVQSGIVAENAVEYDSVKWKYVQSELLQRNIDDVLLEKEMTEALCRLNPEIAAQPERAEEVIHFGSIRLHCASLRRGLRSTSGGSDLELIGCGPGSFPNSVDCRAG